MTFPCHAAFSLTSTSCICASFGSSRWLRAHSETPRTPSENCSMFLHTQFEAPHIPVDAVSNQPEWMDFLSIWGICPNGGPGRKGEQISLRGPTFPSLAKAHAACVRSSSLDASLATFLRGSSFNSSQSGHRKRVFRTLHTRRPRGFDRGQAPDWTRENNNSGDAPFRWTPSHVRGVPSTPLRSHARNEDVSASISSLHGGDAVDFDGTLDRMEQLGPRLRLWSWITLFSSQALVCATCAEVLAVECGRHFSWGGFTTFVSLTPFRSRVSESLSVQTPRIETGVTTSASGGATRNLWRASLTQEQAISGARLHGSLSDAFAQSHRHQAYRCCPGSRERTLSLFGGMSYASGSGSGCQTGRSRRDEGLQSGRPSGVVTSVYDSCTITVACLPIAVMVLWAPENMVCAEFLPVQVALDGSVSAPVPEARPECGVSLATPKSVSTVRTFTVAEAPAQCRYYYWVPSPTPPRIRDAAVANRWRQIAFLSAASANCSKLLSSYCNRGRVVLGVQQYKFPLFVRRVITRGMAPAHNLGNESLYTARNLTGPHFYIAAYIMNWNVPKLSSRVSLSVHVRNKVKIPEDLQPVVLRVLRLCLTSQYAEESCRVMMLADRGRRAPYDPLRKAAFEEGTSKEGLLAFSKH
ncbi:hypothetical protein BXZ70DRAFT_1039799 [Cristinia sonorae]|uniref:Uncharacterized protein n=1 Tax=Cristinia sonorae TaxID=1940300 RepID=A0A8K0XM28_9AGAR|nr:hypothetical protein BXZ70DRAFT_1039799 [Cristinia sonorae]